jgi:hypothetical protein
VAVAIGDRHDGHAVDDARHSESGDGQPSWSQKVEVRIVGPQGIDPGGGDHQVQRTEDNTAQATAR